MKAGTVNAVREISFSLKKDECFILLGVNGAGKTSTFKCLTLEEVVSGGEIKINGEDVSRLFRSSDSIKGIMGYCP